MSQASKKTIAKYMSMVATAGRVWTEQEIISFRSLLNNKLSNQVDVRDMLLERFNKSLDVAPFQLESQQQVKGLTWLHKTQLNKKGDLRAAKTTFLGADEADMMRNFESFEFVGLRNIETRSTTPYAQYVPVYRLNTTDGRWFEYTMTYNGYSAGFEITDGCYQPRQPRLKIV